MTAKLWPFSIKKTGQQVRSQREGAKGRAVWGIVGGPVAVVVALTGCGGTSTSESASPPPVVSGAQFAPISPAAPATAKTVKGTLDTADGRTRTYHLYVPTTIQAGTSGAKVPLLVALHGGVGSGTQFEDNSGFDGLAQANTFIVAYPDGIGAAGTDALRTWNGGNCCGPAVKSNVDDVAFISALVDRLEREYSIDTARVFAAGHSNGGIMAYRLACELSSKIVAIGVQSSALGVAPCAPPHPVSLLHIHGTNDRNLPLTGGVGERGISGVDFPPAIEGVRALSTANNCPAEPRVSPLPGNPDVTEALWAPCRGDSAVDFLIVNGASHAWMGHTGVAPALVGTPYSWLDSSATIWSFLTAHPRQ
ncbi:MAG: PHB depolymerase family esterase [Actinomycetes bacterium]